MGDEHDSPNHNHKSTPPTQRKVRNPFDSALIERLHKPICSPGMCKIYKKKNSGSFRWDIDQACTLLPADIVACNSQFEPSPDPALEKIAEEATEIFFSQEMVMPSPMESSKKIKPLLHISDSSLQIASFKESTIIMKDVSAQTVLTLPPELPPEIEKILQPFCTYNQDQNISGDYEITANGSLCRKLYFEEHSDLEHYDSEQTDDEIHVEQRPPSSYEAHTPVTFSPDLPTRDLVAKGMKRTFGTPLNKGNSATSKPRNKILDVADFGEACFSPIEFRTPKRVGQESGTSSSLASTSISPLTKAASSDEEKNNFTSPESEAMATCLDCIVSGSDSEKKGPCFCPSSNKTSVRRSTSLKESPPRSRKGSQSFSEKRSLSLSSLHRSRSVQKLDFSMDMSIDGSLHDRSQADSESTPPPSSQASWSIVEETSIHQLVKLDSFKNNSDSDVQSSTKIHINILDDTPIKGKSKSNVLSHEISKIRAPLNLSPAQMSLDNSLDNSENALGLEDKKVDFNKIDLKYLTENASQFDNTNNALKMGGDSSVSFKRVDSGFNENTFYANASSYYESAIKPSELTVTNMSKMNNSKTALKEISNIPWARFDSGFKDENSSDSVQFYTNNESMKKGNRYRFSEAQIEDKENVATENFGFFVPNNKNDAMSMSDMFADDMTFNCNFSSTPSKNKSRKIHS
ncbi:protein aurora borealis [Amyelois transitella]|uniref:protein aurora borealis n=1 Tax=Amyelois transitella TaxID=680683 RepID=UPI00298FD74C|nr:protein aurora borealis [Amyelois transitella]